MFNYFINKNLEFNGENEIHKEGCSFMPEKENLEFLGSYDNANEAKIEAIIKGYNADGCYFCCREAHTK